MKYLIAYIAGHPLGVFLLNKLWYPAPDWAHGVLLGLTVGAAAICGGLLVVGLLFIAEKTGLIAILTQDQR